MNDLFLALTGFFGYAATLVGLEVLARKLKLSPEYVRRLSHASATIFAAIIGAVLSAPVFLGVVALFIPIMWFSRRRRLFRHIHEVSRPTMGEELLPLGIIAAYLIAGGNMTIFVPAVLIVGLADPITGVAMQKFKNHAVGYFVFLFVTLLLLGFFSVSLVTAVLIAALTAGVERLSPYGTDNLTIPLVAALALRLL